MQDLLRGAQFLLDLGKLRAGKAARGVTTRLLGRFWGMPPEKYFLNSAIWCVLEYIFIIFFT